MTKKKAKKRSAAKAGTARKATKRKISAKPKKVVKPKREHGVSEIPARKNENLGRARIAKEDEFYTQLPDIEREMRHYKSHFKNKVVYLNCDDPRISNFFHYFTYNFEALGLKKVIATCYKSQTADLFSQHESEQAIWLEYAGDKDGNKVPDPSEIGIRVLQGDGDFRSEESIELLKQADIVVTNPPFSLFRQYVAQLIEHDKKFVIVGPTNAITYKEIFTLIRDNKIWLGNGFQAGNAFFAVSDPGNYAKGVYNPETGLVKFRNVSWYTNLDIAKRHEEMMPVKSYSRKDYPTYDNFDAIEVSKVADIPKDYDKVMGVPITFLERHNPDQFEIVGNEYTLNIHKGRGYINGKRVYARIFIRRRKHA